ncbi:MAG: ABC transporter substrate-binding protein, partial [Conexivisphaera sp.]
NEVEFLHYAWFDLEHQTTPLRIVLVATSGTWGNTEAYAINQTIYANGWQNNTKLVDTIFVTEGTSEFGPTLARLVSDNPGAIITALVPPDRANFVEQAAAVPALKGILTINDAISDDPSYYSAAGRYAIGTFVGGTAYSLMSNPNNPTIAAKWNEFRAEYKALSGQIPGALAASGYDHMWIIAYALKDAGTTQNTAVINALDNLKLTPGLESHLIRLYAPTPSGTVFFTDPSSGMAWHSANFQPVVLEAFYNSTSNSVYTQVVWPPQLATTQPVLGIFP